MRSVLRLHPTRATRMPSSSLALPPRVRHRRSRPECDRPSFRSPGVAHHGWGHKAGRRTLEPDVRRRACYTHSAMYRILIALSLVTTSLASCKKKKDEFAAQDVKLEVYQRDVAPTRSALDKSPPVLPTYFQSSLWNPASVLRIAPEARSSNALRCARTRRCPLAIAPPSFSRPNRQRVIEGCPRRSLLEPVNSEMPRLAPTGHRLSMTKTKAVWTAGATPLRQPANEARTHGDAPCTVTSWQTKVLMK